MLALPDIGASWIVVAAALVLVAVLTVLWPRSGRVQPKTGGAAVGAALLTSIALVGGCSPSAASTSPLAGSGPLKTETRPVGEFTTVQVRHGIKLELEIGTPAKVEVTAAENLLPITLTSVTGSQLTVDASRDYTSSDGITVRVTSPMLSELALAGGASGHVGGVAASDLHVRTDGGGELRVAGTARALTLTTKGGGIVELGELTVEEATVDLAGGVKVTLNASRSVTGKAVGGVVLVLKGSPATVAVDATGGAAVVRQ